MARVKWISIMVSLFDSRKIKKIQALPHGPALVIIRLRRLFLAGSISDDGRAYLTRDIPCTRQSLVRQPLSIAGQALAVFARFGMIDQSDGSLRLINRQKYRNTQSLKRDREQTGIRVSGHRQNKMSVTNHKSVTVTLA